MAQTRRVVVTGLGAVTPVGNNYQAFFENLLQGKSGATAITKFDTSLFKTRFACEIKNFNPAEVFDIKELRKMDLYSQYAMVRAAEALQVLGIDLEQVNKNRFGVIWASGNGGFKTLKNRSQSLPRVKEYPGFRKKYTGE